MFGQGGSFSAPSSIDMSIIPYPDLHGYGKEHHEKTAQLTKYLAEYDKTLTQNDRNILWAVSILHDVGRVVQWGQPDVNHYQRSAAIAEQVLKLSGEDFNKPAFIEETCRLIANHGEHDTSDPRLKIFFDAERLECVRVFPNSRTGLQTIRNVCDPAKFSNKLCGEQEFIKQWMRFRGWSF